MMPVSGDVMKGNAMIQNDPHSNPRPHCQCGLRIERRNGWWRHLPTVAGINADHDHDAEPRLDGK